MHPIWHEGHGDDPIGLSDAPEGWPSSNGGPKANYKNGFTPESNNRYVVNQTDFDNTARHVYSLDVSLLEHFLDLV